MSMAIHFSSKEQDVATPAYFFNWLDLAFSFTLDVCALPINTKCRRFFSPADNGLAQSWAGEICFMNPRYKDLPQWIPKARFEAESNRATVVSLLPMRPDAWWHKWVLGSAGKLRDSYFCPFSKVFWMLWERLTVGIHHVEERIVFKGEESGAPFPSVVVIFDPPKRKIRTRLYKVPPEQPVLLNWSRP